MMEVEIVECLHSHSGIGRDTCDFERGSYYLCIKSARYNIPYVYKEQQICSPREHSFIEKKCKDPVRFKHIQFLKLANKKELKIFKRKYFENPFFLKETMDNI